MFGVFCYSYFIKTLRSTYWLSNKGQQSTYNLEHHGIRAVHGGLKKQTKYSVNNLKTLRKNLTFRVKRLTITMNLNCIFL